MEDELLGHLLEQHLFADVIDGDIFRELEYVGDEFRWSTSVSGNAI